jgi:hypothetical protein
MLRRSIARGWVLGVSLVTAYPAAAEEVVEETAAAAPLDVNLFISSSYSYNFNQPSSRTNQYRVFDGGSRSATIDVAEVVLQRPVSEPGAFGFRADIEAGQSVPQVSSALGLFRDDEGGTNFDLQQALVSYIAPVGRGLRIDAGKAVTHLGLEVIEGYDGWNDHHSRSILFGYAIAFTHTGVKASYPLTDRVAGMVWLHNGWDVARDNNKWPSLGAQLAVTPTDAVSAYLNYNGGPERADSSDIRHIVDVVAVWKATPALTLSVNADLGSEAGAAMDGGRATWWGVAGYGRVALGERASIAVRGEVFGDPDAARTGAVQRLTEVTLTSGVKVKNNLELRIEGRVDHSDVDAFEDEQGMASRANQVTLATNALVSF